MLIDTCSNFFRAWTEHFPCNLFSVFLTESSLQAISLINNQTLPILYSLSPIVVLLQIFPFFYRYFHGHCSQEIKNIIPDPLRRVRTTRSSTYSCPFQVTKPNTQTLAHKSSPIPRTSRPPTTFPGSYNLSSFKSSINKIDLVYLCT